MNQRSKIIPCQANGQPTTSAPGPATLPSAKCQNRPMAPSGTFLVVCSFLSFPKSYSGVPLSYFSNRRISITRDSSDALIVTPEIPKEQVRDDKSIIDYRIPIDGYGILIDSYRTPICSYILYIG